MGFVKLELPHHFIYRIYLFIYLFIHLFINLYSFIYSFIFYVCIEPLKCASTFMVYAVGNTVLLLTRGQCLGFSNWPLALVHVSLKMIKFFILFAYFILLGFCFSSNLRLVKSAQVKLYRDPMNWRKSPGQLVGEYIINSFIWDH